MSANNFKKSNKREYQGAISKLALLSEDELLSYCLNKDDARIIGIVLDFKAQMATENPEMNNINVEVLDKEPKSRYDEIMEELSLLSDDAC